MKKKAILFDLDGTLIDSERYYLEGTYAWMKELGFKGKISDINVIVGTTMDYTYQYLHSLLPNISLETLIKRNQTYFKQEHPIPYKDLLFPDVDANLTYFKQQDYYLGLCSLDTKQELTAFLEATFGFAFFDVVLSSEEVLKPKPHPEIWLKAMNQLKVSPIETIIVEDSYNGICSAKNAGVLTWARQEKRFLIKQDHADKLFINLAELAAFLKE